MATFIRILAISIYILGIAACIYLISGKDLTARESGLLSVVLTFLSILATWTVSHLYSESQHSQAIKDVQESHRANLKTYARQAAEKVNNLSNELSKLSAYLEKELATSDYDNSQEELNAKEERIESAIHIINALKSVNDTSLSDWEGVIGDELDQQREEKEEREEELEEILSKYDSDISALQADFELRGDYTHTLQSEIEGLRSQLHYLTSRITGLPYSLSSFPSKRKNMVTTNCPVCNQPITFQIKRKAGTIKAVDCKSCGSKLIARSTENGHATLEEHRPTLETFSCGECGAECQISIDQMPGVALSHKCDKCGSEFRVVRTKQGVSIKKTAVVPPPKKTELDEGMIKSVKDLLPPQPWPTGIHKLIATKLNLNSHVVFRAITELVRRGIFNPQIDGKLYIPAPSESKETGE